jgi:hypothetical protein
MENCKSGCGIRETGSVMPNGLHGTGISGAMAPAITTTAGRISPGGYRKKTYKTPVIIRSRDKNEISFTRLIFPLYEME